MLTEKRYEVILKCLNDKNSITVTELKELLGISESTIRRDLTALDKAGKLVKVFGGAVAVHQARIAYVLADYSKFGNVSSVTFANLEEADVLTDRKPPESFSGCKNILVV